MIEVVIDRSKWARTNPETKEWGEKSHHLLNHNGYMCCMGFACAAIGKTRNEIIGIAYPFDIGVDNFSGQISNILNANDVPQDHGIATSQQQEAEVTRLFAKCGFDVTFIN